MELPRRSIEDLLYEAMTSLLFYPRALWRVLLEAGRGEAAGGPVAGLVSPPLFLMISILIAHALERAMGAGGDRPVAVSQVSLLIFRLLAFSLFPLVMTVGALRREGLPIDHATLREPFYRQCVYTAPFSISVCVAAVLVQSPAAPVRMAGAVLTLAATAWYLCVQTRWLGARLVVGRWRAFRTALWLLVVALSFCGVLALVICRPSHGVVA
jgi:hypothetical protein